MVVAAEGLDRARVGRAVGPDLEDVAVVLLVDALGAVLALPLLAGVVDGLLAGQPGPPRRRAAGAVGGGAGDRDELTEVGAARVGGDHGAAARRRARVVDSALDERHRDALTGLDLVVLDERVAPTPAAEHHHPVVVGRRLLTRPQGRLPGGGDDGVREPLGQREDPLGVVHERRERLAGTLASGSAGPRRLRLGKSGNGTGDGQADPGRGSSGEQGASSCGHGLVLLGAW